MSGEGLLPMARTSASDAAPLLTFDEAIAVGEQLHDRVVAKLGTAPMTRDDLGWADMVQCVLIAAREQVDLRAGERGSGV